MTERRWRKIKEDERWWTKIKKDEKWWKMMEEEERKWKNMKEWANQDFCHTLKNAAYNGNRKNIPIQSISYICAEQVWYRGTSQAIVIQCECVCVWKMLSVGPVMYQCTGHYWTLIASLDSPATTYFKHRTKHLFTSTATLKSHSNRHPGWQRRLTSVAPSRQKAANTAPATTRQVSN